MNTETVTKYQILNVEVAEVEKRIAAAMRRFEKRQDIDGSRNRDHGNRGFALMIYYDEINLLAFDPDFIAGLKADVVKHRTLRKTQIGLETEILADQVIAAQMMSGGR
jgi:hypothetical protein